MLQLRTFSFEDQQRFAAISGDHNPMHLDIVAARRTQAGAPVVHGVHLLLWAMDAFASATDNPAIVQKIRARFNKFVYVGENAEVSLTGHSPASIKLSVTVNGTPVSEIVIDYGAVKTVSKFFAEPPELLVLPAAPLAIELEQMTDLSGRLPFAASPEHIAQMFPAAAKWIGARRIAGLAASTNLVGMVCPGLNSIFNSLTVETCSDSNPENTLGFRVTSADLRFRLVRMAIAGGGIDGKIESLARMPPTLQASMQSLAGIVKTDEFVGSTALIVGGSRGLGEITAKLIAYGGGRVIITYRLGKADAEKVAEEIRLSGGSCELLRFDANLNPTQQLAGLTEPLTHFYYFATPTIFGRQSDTYFRQRLDDFLEVYVDGFWRLVQALRKNNTKLSIFYPSSVAVDERPRGMTEYVMAKMAGEALCGDINKVMVPLHVSVARLPRIETDQTATFMEVKTHSALETMLPLIREVQSWPKKV